MGAVTYIDDQRNHRTFSFELIEKHGMYRAKLFLINFNIVLWESEILYYTPIIQQISSIIGCGAELATRLSYAFDKVVTMLQSSNKSAAQHTNQNLGTNA